VPRERNARQPRGSAGGSMALATARAPRHCDRAGSSGRISPCRVHRGFRRGAVPRGRHPDDAQGPHRLWAGPPWDHAGHDDLLLRSVRQPPRGVWRLHGLPDGSGLPSGQVDDGPDRTSRLLLLPGAERDLPERLHMSRGRQAVRPVAGSVSARKPLSFPRGGNAMMKMTIEPVSAFSSLDVLVAMVEGLFSAEGLDLRMASRESRDIRSTTEGTLSSPVTNQGRLHERGEATMFQG